MPDNELSKAQTLAIEHVSGPMQVLAGPGSGKTFLTIRRISHLIRHHGISPNKILVITFTKAAAGEMKERFEKFTGNEYSQVRFGTFHAIYYHILRQSGHPDLMLASVSDRKKYLYHSIKILEIKTENDTELVENLLKWISREKNGLEGNQKPLESQNKLSELSDCDKYFSCIYKEYCRIMKEENKLDYDDMILLCHQLLIERKDVLSYWQKEFSHILVDEFQDIAPLQYDILRQLALPENNIFVVGDDDQSIYGFRGAGPNIMKKFMEDYPESGQIVLDINYRSGAAIIGAAGSMIADNECRFDKQMKAVGKKDDVVKIIAFSTKEEEYTYLTEMLVRKTPEEWKQTAVIYRTNAEAAALSRQLTALHIPFHINEKLPNLFEQPIAKDLLSYLDFAFDCYYTADKGGKRSDFFRIMNKPSRYIHRTAVETLVTEKSLLDYYNEKPYMQNNIRKLFIELKYIAALRPYLAINYIRKSLGYDDFIVVGKEKEEKIRLKEIADAVQKTTSGFRSLKEWKRYISEYEDMICNGKRGDTEEKEGVSILTMHGSKGLEYNTVYLPDVTVQNIPNRKAVTAQNTEEERRLLYVAMTRAKEWLEVLYYGEMSPFIKNIERQINGRST